MLLSLLFSAAKPKLLGAILLFGSLAALAACKRSLPAEPNSQDIETTSPQKNPDPPQNPTQHLAPSQIEVQAQVLEITQTHPKANLEWRLQITKVLARGATAPPLSQDSQVKVLVDPDFCRKKWDTDQAAALFSLLEKKPQTLRLFFEKHPTDPNAEGSWRVSKVW